MAHATGSRRQLIYGKETGGFKVKPTTGIKILRNTGDSINLTKNTLTSAELSGDRAIRFLRHGNETVSGDVSFEFAYADFDDLLASSLGSAWTDDVDAVYATSTLTFSGVVVDGEIVTIGTDVYEFVASFPYTAGNIVVDVSGGVTTTNAVTALITASAGGVEPITITDSTGGVALVTADVAGTLANAIVSTTDCTNGAFSTATLIGGVDGTVAGVLKQGVLDIETYTFEKGFQDIEQYIAYKGCAVNTFSIDMASDALVTGSVGFVGAGTDGFATASTLSTPTPATANEPFTSYQVEGYIQIGAPTTNVLADTCLVTACNFSVDNGITANYSLCSNEAASITPDRINVTGNITVLFADEKEVKKFIDEEETSLSVKLADPDGQNYTFFCPKIKYTGGDIAVSGGGVISISLPFQALYDDTAGVKTSIEITRADSL